MGELLKEEFYPRLLKSLPDDMIGKQQIFFILKNVFTGKIPNIDVYVDSWPNYEVVVIKQTGLEEEILRKRHYVIYTKDNRNLARVLLLPGLLDWKREGLIFAQKMTDIEPIKATIQKHNRDGYLSNEVYTERFHLKKENLKVFPVPDGMTIKPIPHSLVKTIKAGWKFSNEVEDGFFPYIINNFHTVAMFDVDGSLIGYMIQTHIGTVGTLHVLPEKRGQGHSKVILSQLCRLVLEEEDGCTSSIEPSNEISIALHTKVGFTNTNSSEFWVDLNPR